MGGPGSGRKKGGGKSIRQKAQAKEKVSRKGLRFSAGSSPGSRARVAAAMRKSK